MITLTIRRCAFSLIELLAVVALLGLLATVTLPRILSSSDSTRQNACYVNKGEIELQAQLFRRNTGDYPQANLADITGDADYFPDGPLVCPFDGTTYTIDETTGLVVGHNH